MLTIEVDDILVLGSLYLIVIHHTGRELLASSEDIHSLVEQCVALPIQLAHLTHQVGIDLMEIHVCYYHNGGKGTEIP